MIHRKLLSLRGMILFTIIINHCYDMVGCSEPKLKMLHVIFRHGEKIPHREYHNYPNDPHGNHSFYPISSGGLTKEGKMREYKIGKMLRRRYDEYFGKFYSTDDIYARSSDFPRAQMSLQLLFAGLFPPVGEQIWNDNLSWQPTASVFENNENDQMFFPNTCPLYKLELKNLIESKEIQVLINEHKNTMDYITKHSGKLVKTPETVYQLFTLLREESMENLKLPDWTSKVYPDVMKNITKLHFDLRSYTTKLKRLGGGIMLRKITDDMSELFNHEKVPRGPKSFFFSGHEDNVASLSRTLGTKEPELPDYGSTIIIETLQGEETSSTYYVRIVLWTGVSEELITLNVPGCGELCPLDKFLVILKPVIADEWELKCREKSTKNNAPRFNNNISKIVYSTILMIIINMP